MRYILVFHNVGGEATFKTWDSHDVSTPPNTLKTCDSQDVAYDVKITPTLYSH